MRAVRALADSLYLAIFLATSLCCALATTTAPADGLDDNDPMTVERSQPQLKCEPERIDVSLIDDLQPTVINYTVVVNRPNNCDDYNINLVSCDGTQPKYFPFQFHESGQYCVKFNKFYKLEFQGVSTECFHVTGTKLTHMAVNFINRSMASVEFQTPLPSWAKGLHVRIVGTNFTDVGITTSNTSNVIIPGNYSPNQQYYLWYAAVLQHGIEGETCIDYSAGKRQNEEVINKYLPTLSPVSPSGKDTVVVVGTIAGVFCLVLVVCAIKTFIRRSHDRERRDSSNSEILLLRKASTSKTVGDVVLIHAQDTSHLARLCQDLKDSITKHCGRKVVDIAMTDVQRQATPEVWMSQALSQPGNTVLLVMSAAVVALHTALQQGNDASGCLAVAEIRGEMRPWDILLPICLRYLQEHLSQNYARLFVVRFQQVSSSSRVEDIPELVPAKRFVLPQHQSELQTTLRNRNIIV